MKKDRRQFLKAGALGWGITASAWTATGAHLAPPAHGFVPRRPVRLAAIDTGYAWMRNDVAVEDRLAWVEDRLFECLLQEPDIVCLPETFASSWVKQPAEAQNIDGPLVRRFAAHAREHRCYLIVPLMLSAEGGVRHNGAVLLDPSGTVVGVSYKTHLTEEELRSGIRPGPVEPPVMETSFGRIGIQICYDANHFQTWTRLVRRGAEVVFFPSEFHGGRILNAQAWMNQCWIVAATALQARIIDPGGDDLTASGNFRGFVCETINLDACLVHIWPHVRKLSAIRKKYGAAVHVKLWQEENYFLLASLHPSLTAKDILDEFNIPTYRQQIEKL